MIARLVFVIALSFSCELPLCVLAQSTIDQPSDGVEILKARGELFTTRKNPITLPLPRDDNSFHFAIYGDRTGGDAAGLKFLRQAVEDTNLMDPDFVMTVGDLIQGYNRPPQWMNQMREFKGIMSGLKMNWFPVAGNHDIYWEFRDPNRPAIHHEANFEQHFGPLWYSFKHKNNGFIALYSDEGNTNGEKGFREARLQNMSPTQLTFLEKALNKLADCQQVFVFLHHPRWLGGRYEGSNWPDVHKRLVAAGNVSAVFGGHIHHMTYTGPVDGIEYFTLATTGAHLGANAPELGYLHHFNVVTVREDKFQVATIPVGTVIDPKTFKMDFLSDVELVRSMRPERAGNRLLLDTNSGSQSDYSIRITNPGKCPIEVALTPNTHSKWQALPDHQHIVVPPGKTEGMKFHFYRNADSDLAWTDFSPPTLSMSVDYLHTSARIRLPDVKVPIDLGLLVSSGNTASTNNCLNLRGRQTSRIRRSMNSFPNDSARLNFGDFELPQGPFTLEAWIYPTDTSVSRGIVCNTQSSGYALFLHEGRPQFDVHLNGRYVSPSLDKKVTLNKWTHIAGVFDGSSAKLFLDGKLVRSLPASGTRTKNQLPLYVGADPDGFGNPSREFAGKIDEVRLSKTARYSNNFDPKLRFESDESTVVLLHCDNKFGPFLINDANTAVPAICFGKAEITPRN